ncbi:MAG TPA: hypothetical protein VK989_14440, partial [Polyangia bacterium]|nr:hypothetical protein [Polyangia bacterium]
MSTSDPTGLTIPSGPSPSPSIDPRDASVDALAGQIARLANELFSGPPSPFQQPGPSAFNVGGGGLAATAPEHPPTPGYAQALPVASAPPPKESDLRTVPAAFSSLTGLPPLALARTPDGSGASPYFLDGAGFGAPSNASRLASPPASPPSAPAISPPTAVDLAAPVEDLPARPPAAPGIDFDVFEIRPEATPKLGAAPGIFDAASIKKDFPIL